MLCFSQPSLFFSGQGKYRLVSIPTEQFSLTVPSAGRLQGYHGYLLSRVQALAGTINIVGTSAQSHLLVMSLIEKNDHVRKLITSPAVAKGQLNIMKASGSKSQ